MSRTFSRIDPVDMLAYPEGSVLLYQHRLVALSPLGAAAFDLVGTGTRADDVARGMGELFGAPADGSLLDAAIGVLESLVGEGVLSEEA